MKPKYTPCKNCGANEYEIKSLNTLKCEFCGTEYEIELPEPIIVPIDNQRLRWNGYVPALGSTCVTSYFTGTVAIDKY